MKRIQFEPEDANRVPRVSFVPLIDIVLQIICFYLFVSAGVQMYQDSSVQLPEMRSDALIGESPARFTINIDAEGGMDLNGEPLTVATLPGALVAARARAVEMKQEWSVAIRADKRQQIARLDSVLQACRDAQVPRVSIRAMAPTAGGRNTP